MKSDLEWSKEAPPHHGCKFTTHATDIGSKATPQQPPIRHATQLTRTRMRTLSVRQHHLATLIFSKKGFGQPGASGAHVTWPVNSIRKGIHSWASKTAATRRDVAGSQASLSGLCAVNREAQADSHYSNDAAPAVSWRNRIVLARESLWCGGLANPLGGPYLISWWGSPPHPIWPRRFYILNS